MIGSSIGGRRRKPALILLSLLLLAALLLPAAGPAAASTGQSYGVPPFAQAIGNVNIRSGPGTQFPVIGRVFAGQTVQVLSMSANGWYQIACQSGGMVTCWITGSSRYVRPVWSLDPGPGPCPGWPPSCTPPTPPPPCSGWPSSCTPPVSQVQALRVVNVRSGPGMGFSVVGQLAPWQVVQLTGVSADGYWYRIVCPFYCPGDCWVSSQSWLVRPV